MTDGTSFECDATDRWLATNATESEGDGGRPASLLVPIRAIFDRIGAAICDQVWHAVELRISQD